MSAFDFSDINLDFLESSPPKRTQGNERIDSPIIKCELVVGTREVVGKKGKSKKHSEWAKKIAKADELVKEINKLKREKLELQTQLIDFQKSAQAIQSLYTTEKKASDLKSYDIKQLQEKFNQADANLTVQTLKCEQMEDQLSIHKDRPVDYNVLVVKYLRLLNKLDEEECQKNFTDRLMTENLRQYCAKYKVKAPPPACPKQYKAKRLQKEDAVVQCELLKDMSIAVKSEVRSQSTQCHSEMRSQGSQHISTMTTRGTTTACFIKYRTVGTSFPESQAAPVVDEILREFAPWQNITPISPLTDRPGTSDRPVENVTKTNKSVGTCTWLCNVRRTIDFMPRSKQQRSQNARFSSCDVSTSQSIKQEVTTPSPSPTPNSQTTVPGNHNINPPAPQSASSAVTPNQSTVSNPLFAALQSSLPLGHLSESSFDGLWHIFGRMLLGLLQTSNAGVATNVNQRQFYSWLRELYESSGTVSDINGPEQSENLTATNVATSPIDVHTPNSPAPVPGHSETLATHAVATSPLHFNQTSPFGSPNIVRPHPRRSYGGEHTENLEDIPEDVMQPNVHTTDILVDNINCKTNSTSTSDNESHTSINLTTEPSTSFGAPEKHQKKKRKILYEIQELLPEVKLCKSKRKALKRLLKIKKQKKKNSLKDRQIAGQMSSNEPSNNCSNTMGHQEETAVDFLKGIFESSNSTSQSHNINEIEKVRRVNTHEDIQYSWDSGTYRANYDVKNSVEIVRVDSIRDYEMDTNTNNKVEICHHLPTSKVNQFNNSVDLNIDDSTNFKKPKNVHKNVILCKKSNITNKKELYANLFGDSDTEVDDGEDVLEVSGDVSKRRNKLYLSESETSCDEDEFKPASVSQNNNFENKDVSAVFLLNPVEKAPTWPQNIIQNNRVSKMSSSVDRSDNNTDTSHSQIHYFDDIHLDLQPSLSPSHNISVPDISTPVLKTIEMSLMNETATNFMFGQMDKETQERLETIIDKQLLELTHNKVEDVKAVAENISSDFEKDFELSSEEDDNNIVPITKFIVPKAFDTKEIHTESLQCRTSSDLDSGYKIKTSRKDNGKKIIIGKQSMELSPNKVEDARAVIEDIPSEFEKDFELSSEEDDDDIVSETTFLVPKAFDTKEIHTESLQCRTSRDLDSGYKITTSRKDNGKKIIIDKQSMELSPNKVEDARAVNEDIPSEFEKVFELSSEEDDDDIVSETTFLVPITYVAKEAYTESLQCRASSDLEKGFEIITSKKDDIKAASEQNANCNTIRTINCSHPIVGVMNDVSENCNDFDFRETKNFTFHEKCDDTEALILEKPENVRNIFNAKYDNEVKDQTFFCKDSRSAKTNSATGNFSNKHVDIVPKNNNTSMAGDSTDVSNSALKCPLPPVFSTSEQSLENMSTTLSEVESSVIEISSDITSMNMSNENEMLIHESPAGNAYENMQTIKCQQTTLGAVSNSGEASNVENSEDLRKSYSFLTETSERKGRILRFPSENAISAVKILADNTDMEEMSTNKIRNSSAVDEKEPPQSVQATKYANMENCVPKFPSMSAPKVSEVMLEVNSFNLPNGIELSTRCEEDISTSSTDEEISVINISFDNTSIENETRDITTTPNDKLIIDDGSDEVDEEKQDELELKNTSKPNAILELPQPYKIQSTEINTETGKSEKTDLCTQNSRCDLNTSTEISSLLNSTLYTNILTDSILPLVDDVLRDDELMMETAILDKRPKTRGRKRKSECPLEEQPSCKRSERLRARKNNLSVTPVEIGKYTRINRSSVSDMQSKLVEKDIKKEEPNASYANVKEVNSEMPVVRMGFFREIDDRVTEESLMNDNPSNSLQAQRNEAVNTGAKNDRKLSNIGSLITKDISSSFLSTSSPLLVNSSSTRLQKCMEMRGIHGIDDTISNCPKIDESVVEETVTPLKMQSSQTALDIQNATNLKQKPLNIDTSSSNQSMYNYSESPLSPLPPDDTIESILNSATFDIPLELSPQYRPRAHTNSILENLMRHYSPGKFKQIVTSNSQTVDNRTKREIVILGQYENALKEYCCNPALLDPDIMASEIISILQRYSIDYQLLCCVIIKTAKNAETSLVKESELPSIIQEIPPRHICLSLQRLFYLLKHLTSLNPTFCIDLLKKIDCSLFNLQQAERLSLNSSVHLIQLYLLSCKLIEHELSQHPARILIAKCLYFHTIKSISMIHEVLMWYPTAMPPKEDRTYDRSDALITVIQQLLMSTKYDMDNPDVRGKSLLSKLRFEYHYLPFKPSLDETICNLVEKLKMSKFCNLNLAFSLICKRMAPPRSEKLLQTHILPLANEYFNQALKNTDSDERISVILDIISKVVKPFPSDWDVEVYLNLFSRFLNNFNRAVIQESAVCSIIRLQRFGYVNCFHRLISFKPTFELSSTAQAMLKTFIHRKPLYFLTTITNQSRANFS